MKKTCLLPRMCILILGFSVSMQSVSSTVRSQQPSSPAICKTGFLDVRYLQGTGTVQREASPLFVGLKTSVSEPALPLCFPEFELFRNENGELLKRAIDLYGISNRCVSHIAEEGKDSAEHHEPELRVIALVSGVGVESERDKRLLMRIHPEQGEDCGVIWQINPRYSLVAIKPESGIGGIRIERLVECWPDEVVVRLGVTGLESLKIADTEKTFHWEVTSYPPYTKTLTVIETNGRIERISSMDQTHGALMIKSEKPEIPIDSGYFEFTIPAEILKRNPESFSVRWIDFYRN